MKYPRIYRSAVDGKFYKYAGDPEVGSRRFEAAGIITPTDVSDVTAVSVLDQVLGYARPAYNLRNLCKVVRADQLTLKVDVYGVLSAATKVEPLEEAAIDQSSRTRVSFDLWKNAVHVVAEDEAQKKSVHNELALHISDAGKALAKAENDQIATIIEAATNTSAGSDWGTVTSGRSANSPYDDIVTAINTIEGTGGFEPDMLAAHPYVWMDFFGNDFVKGQLQGTVYPATKMFDLPGMPGMKGLSDWGLTSTQALVLDSKNAVILTEGPTAAAKYRNEPAGYDAYLIRQWLEPKIVQQNAIYELTAVHA